MILGLDISTSITGYTILDYQGTLVRCSAWDTRNKNKFDSHFKKADYIKHELLSIKSQIPVSHVYWICCEIFETTPAYLTAGEARKLCKIRVPRGQKAKKVIMQWVLDNEKDFDVEYTSRGNPKPKYFDMADSLVMARAGLIKST